MSDLTLQLGSFTFEHFEIPESLSFPGEQDLGVHKFIGSGKTADAMGWYEDGITWGGRFRGPNAVSRVTALRAIFKAGQAVILSWGAFNFLVVPRRFEPDFQRTYEIPYRLTLEVLEDQTSPDTSSSGITIDQQVASDNGDATAYGATINDPTLTTNLASLSTAIGSVQSFDGASQTTLNTVLTPLATALATTNSLLATNNATLQSAGTFGGLTPGGLGSTLAASLTAQATAMGMVANLTALQTRLTRMQVNLNADGASGASIVQAGGNLYAIAAAEYGDPSEWVTLATANDLTDPILEGVNTVRVPASPLGTGGVWPS